MGGTLQPQQIVGHYRVVGPLGAGGMGEVYLAHDVTLERNVALKVLPPRLVADDQRVRRFILEAKSASSLSHPNIVTVFEIGEAQVETAGPWPGAAPVAPIRFIAMELVNGHTLTDCIHREKTDLRTLLGYLAQAAEGLAKAHAAGIVHRDLKPGNIMVTSDGYTKVLDFGLAKLVERRGDSEDETIAPLKGDEATADGLVVGTAGYMSPEQVAGRSADQRSDVFSFGCILYEAATRQRAFAGTTTIDTMHKILHDTPRPIDEIDPRVPADLRRLIRRCLAKNPEQRYQSMKDIAIELGEMVSDFDSLSASASSGSVAVPAPGPTSPGRRYGLIAAVCVLIVAAVIVTWVLASRSGTRPTADENAFATMRTTTVVAGSEIGEPVISPDGRYVAYTKLVAAKVSLHVRQVSTGSDVQIVEPQEAPIRGLTFGPNSDYVYYLVRDKETPEYSTLMEVPALGGPPRKRVADIDTAAAFSADGSRMAFLRGQAKEQATNIVVVDCQTMRERVLATVKSPEELPMIRPAWSPDGRRVAVVVNEQQRGRVQIVAFEVESGTRSALDVWDTGYIGSLVWLPSGARVVTGGDIATAYTQVWQFSDGQARPRRLTHDRDIYADVSASADGRSFLLHRVWRSSTLWAVDGAGAAPRQIPIGENDTRGLAISEDGSVVVSLPATGAVATFNSEGANRRILTAGNLQAFLFWSIPHSNSVVFTGFGADAVGHVWRVDLDGANLTQLTRGNGEYLVVPQPVSPDGRSLLYHVADRPGDEWVLPLGGGNAVRAASGPVGVRGAGFSGDGSMTAVGVMEPFGERMIAALHILRAGTWEAIATIRMTDGARLPKWVGRLPELSFLRFAGGVDTLFKRTLAEGTETPVMRFTDGRVGDYQWAADSRSIVFIGRTGTNSNLYRWDAGAASPQPITRFPAGSIFDFAWAPDGKAVYFTQGTIAQDVALLKAEK